MVFLTPFSSPSSFMPSSKSIVVALTFTMILSSVRSFHTGGPNYSCRNLTPGHSNGTQSGPPPYSLRVNSPVIRPGGSTTVTLESMGDFPFKGFLCAVSNFEDVDNNSVGRVSVSSAPVSPSSSTNIAPITCSRSTPNTAMTHTNSEDKFRVDFDWTAPPSASAGQRFKLRCTCVMNFFRCWTDLRVDLVIGPLTSDTSQSNASHATNNSSSNNRNALSGSNRNSNDNSNNNNGGSGVSGSSFGLGLQDIPANSFIPRSVNNRLSLGTNNSPTLPSNSATAEGVNNIFNSPVSDPAVPRGNNSPAPTNGITSTSVNDVPAILTNNAPNQFTDNNIRPPLEPSLVLVPFPLSGNNVDTGGSTFVLVPNGFQDRESLGTGSLIDRLNQLGQTFGSETPNLNTRANIPSAGPPNQPLGGINAFRPIPMGSNQLDFSQNNQNFVSPAEPANAPNQVRNTRNRNSINASNNSLRRQSFRRNNRIRRPSDSNLLDRNLIRGEELFTHPREAPLGLTDFDFPTGFFITPDALRRFRQRNSL